MVHQRNTPGSFAIALIALIALLPIGCRDRERYRPIEPNFDRFAEPISIRDFVEAEERFGRLEADTWARIESIHRDYLGEYASWRRRSLTSLRSTLGGRTWDEAELDVPTLKKLERNARSTLAGLAALDDRVFFAIEDVVADSAWGEDGVGAIAALRTRRAMARPLAVVEAGGGKPLDSRTWIEGRRWLDGIDAATSDEIEDLLDAFEQTSLPILNSLAVAEWSLPRRKAELLPAATEGGGDDREGSSIDLERIVAEARRPVVEILRQLLDLQVGTIRAIGDRLPGSSGLLLEADLLGGLLLEHEQALGSFAEVIERGLADGKSSDAATALVEALFVDTRPDEDSSDKIWSRLRDEAGALLERRATLLRRLLAAQRAASAPGEFGGSGPARSAREEASKSLLEDLAALDREIVVWSRSSIPRHRIDSMRGSSPSRAATRARSSQEPPGLAADTVLDRFDLPIEWNPLESDIASIFDDEWFGEYLAPLSDCCGIESRRTELSEWFDDDREVATQLIEDREARIMEIGALASENVDAVRRRHANGEEEDDLRITLPPSGIEAICALVSSCSEQLQAEFDLLAGDLERHRHESIDRLCDICSGGCCEARIPLLRLAVTEHLWQATSGDEAVARAAGIGQVSSLAGILAELPLDEAELRRAGRLVEEHHPRIRRALVDRHSAAAGVLTAAYEQHPSVLGRVANSRVGFEVDRYRQMQAAVLAARLDLIRAIESEWPSAAPMLREMVVASRWPGFGGDSASIVRAAAALVGPEASLAAWRAWRSEVVDAIDDEFLRRGWASPTFGSAHSAIQFDWGVPEFPEPDFWRSDADLHFVKTSYREGLLRAARRIAVASENADPEASERLREMIVAMPMGRLDGGRVWE